MGQVPSPHQEQHGHLCIDTFVVKAVAVMSKPGCNCGGQINEEDCLIQYILEVTVNS